MPPRPDPQERHGSQREESPESLQLQMFMDGRGKMFSALSNIMKRVSETQKNMIDKLK